MACDPASPKLTISPKGLLTFFDAKPEWSRKHATAIVGVVGEDLNTACFRHFLKSRDAKAKVLDGPVTTGRQKGPRLDRWIDVKWCDGSRTVFQTEIKNWSAHAISGKTLSSCAPPEEVSRFKATRWEHRWDTEHHTFRNSRSVKKLAKALVRMNPPEGVDEKDVRPLLIFWEALGPRDSSGDHLFCVKVSPRFQFEIPATWPTNQSDFQELWVFSVSSYLRSLDVDTIDLHMPTAAKRLLILSKLFQKKQDAACGTCISSVGMVLGSRTTPRSSL